MSLLVSYCQHNTFQKEEKKGGTNMQWDLAHFSSEQNGEWENQKPKLHFKLALPTRPSHIQTNLVGTKLTAVPKRGGSTSFSLTPDPAQGQVGHSIQGRVLGEQTPSQNCCTQRGHQRCDRPAKGQGKHFQQHTGNRHCMCCFYKLQQTTTSGWGVFPLTNSWNLLTLISVCLYSSLHSRGAQTTKYPERYFLIMGVFCQILCPSFPVWITAFKLVGFPLASSLLQSQCSPKKEFTEN